MFKFIIAILSSALISLANAADIENSIQQVVGTWTPTITTDATPGTPTYTAVRVGSYEQTGRQVTARFSVQLSAWTSPTGNVLISGLPFVSANIANDNGTCFIGSYAVSALPGSNFGITGIITPGTSSIILTSDGGSATSSLAASAAGSTPQFIGTCFYHT